MNKSVFILGDSHLCGPFGRRTYEDLSDKGYRVTLFCGVSSQARNWVLGKAPDGFKCKIRGPDSKKLTNCLGSGKYYSMSDLTNEAIKLNLGSKFDMSFIVLGTNSLSFSFLEKDSLLLIKSLKRISSKCVWVGPPHLREDQKKGFRVGVVQRLDSRLDLYYQNLVEQIKSECAVVDSREFTTQNLEGGQTTDGIHRTKKAGEFWAKSVLKRIQNF